MYYHGPTRYVIRDFSTAADSGVAHIHIVENMFDFHSCKQLENHTVHDEARERGRCAGVDLSAAEFEYVAASLEEAEAAHRVQFTDDFPIHRHECIDRHQKWLAGLVTLPELATELRLATEDMEGRWGRFVDASGQPGRMYTCHRRDGRQLVNPEAHRGDPPTCR